MDRIKTSSNYKKKVNVGLSLDEPGGRLAYLDDERAVLASLAAIKTRTSTN
jgi:hypothetical protein